MADRLKNIAGLLKEGRTRVIVLTTLVALLIAIVVGIINMRGRSTGELSKAAVTSAPGNIQSIPFSAPNPEYAKLQEKQNVQQAKQAEATGGSAIPTIINAENGPVQAPPPNAQYGVGFTELSRQQESGTSFSPKVFGEDQAKTCAQPPAASPVFDSQGRLIGYADQNGKVKGLNGEDIGSVGADGVVTNTCGVVIGKVTISGGQAGTPVYDKNGNLVGYAGSDGSVKDANGNIIGTVGSDGIVRDKSGIEVGRVGSAGPGASVYDQNGRLIGTVGSDGKVRDANGNIVGTIGADGVVHDVNGNVVGRAGAYIPGTPVYDSSGNLLGVVGADGKVRDASGNVIGTVGADGAVRDASGKIIGHVATPVYDASGKLVGYAGTDGKVRDVNGNVIGTVDSNGVVRDVNGKILGRAGAISPGTPVYDSNGKVLGYVGPDGKVRDVNGATIGTVGVDGLVRDVNGSVIGSISPSAVVASSAAAGATPAVGMAATSLGTAVYDPNGKLIGYAGTDGKVRDANGTVIGTVGPDGQVRDTNGNVIGRVATKAGLKVYDASGNLIGTVGADGKVRDARGNVIGTVGPDGQVRDANGNVIGVAQTPQEAAAAAELRRQVILQDQHLSQLMQTKQQNMSQQANQLLSAWTSPTQQWVAGSGATEKGGASAGGTGAGGAGQGGVSGPVFIKAGTIYYGIINTAVNSDEPGPILATIITGQYKGGKLIGSLSNQGQAVLLSFTALSLPNFPQSISINAVAIDQNTARTALSTYTNNHYLLRYGSMFAASFIQGYGQAFSQSGSSTSTNGLTTTSSTPNLNPAAKFMVALGNVGTALSAQMNTIFNTPPTVYVASGTAVGVLFLSDVQLPGQGGPTPASPALPALALGGSSSATTTSASSTTTTSSPGALPPGLH